MAFNRQTDLTNTIGVSQVVKNPPTKQEIWVQSLGRKDPLEKEMAIHSSILDYELDMTAQLRTYQHCNHQSVSIRWKCDTQCH